MFSDILHASIKINGCPNIFNSQSDIFHSKYMYDLKYGNRL